MVSCPLTALRSLSLAAVARMPTATLRGSFACATTVNDLPGNQVKGQEIILQGHIELIPDFLTKTYGIPRKYIELKGLKK